MSIEIIKQPSPRHPAFNTTTLQVSTDTVPTKENPIPQIQVDILSNDSLVQFDKYTKQREALMPDKSNSNRRYAEFDLSPTIKSHFTDKQDKLNDNDKVIRDANLAYDYQVKCNVVAPASKNVKINDETPIILNYTALNSVMQIGESENFSDFSGSFLTEFKRIRKYKDYELKIALLGTNNNTGISFDDKEIFNYPTNHAVVIIDDDIKKVTISDKPTREHELTENPLSLHELHNSDDAPITDSDNKNILVVSRWDPNKDKDEKNLIPTNSFADKHGRKILVAKRKRIKPDPNKRIVPVLPKQIVITNPCTPESPFYVRWINRFAGYDYYMFTNNQKRERSVSDPATFNPFINDLEHTKRISSVMSIKAVEKITVGAQNIPNDEYEALSKIIYSPNIQWYNKPLEKWIDIQVDKGECYMLTNQQSQNLEITFKLPTIQTQF